MSLLISRPAGRLEQFATCRDRRQLPAVLTLLAAADTAVSITADEILPRLRTLSGAFLICGDVRRLDAGTCALLERHRVPLLAWGEQSHPPPAGPGPECFSGRRRPMRHGKTTALKCLPLATELLIVFLTADILWQLLCGRPPFSMWGVSALWRADDRGQQPLSPKAPPLLADSAAERPPLRRLDPPAQPHAGPDLSASSGDSGAPVPLPPVPGIPLGRHACHGPPPPRGRGSTWACMGCSI